MRRWRWFSTLRVVSVAAALCVALGLAAADQTREAHASGTGPCTALTESDLAQPTLAPTDHVSASLSRTQGVVGTALTVTGAGWPANTAVTIDAVTKSYGRIWVAPSNLSQAMTTTTGAFTLPPFSAPDNTGCQSMNQRSDQGGTMTFLIHTVDGRARLPLNFTYLPSPKLIAPRSASALAGASIPLAGIGWEPGELISITPVMRSSLGSPSTPFAPNPASAVSVTADARGAFATLLRLADGPPLTEVTLSVHAVGPRFGDVTYVSDSVDVMYLPKVFPSIHLDQLAVNPGGALTVTGDHWLPNHSIVIEYCRGQMTLPDMVGLRCLVMGIQPVGAQQLGTFVTDGAGKFRVTVRMPANARLGPITVQARVPSAGLIVYAQGQPLMITPTWSVAHPRLAWLLSAAPYLGVAALLAVLLGLFVFARRRRSGDLGRGDTDVDGTNLAH